MYSNYIIIILLASIFIINIVIIILFHRKKILLQNIQISLLKKNQQTNIHIESLFSIYSTLRPRRSLPEMRGWACSPDLLKYLMDTVLNKKPRTIVEAGCGVSTIILGYALKLIGEGKLFSFEHKKEYADQIRENISEHDLDNFITIIDGPLIEYNISEKSWLWYDINSLGTTFSIDMLFIDGPPRSIQELSRYPALNILGSRLSENSIIILDDGNRNDEREIIKKWQKEYSHLSALYLKFEKGAFVIFNKNNKI